MQPLTDYQEAKDLAERSDTYLLLERITPDAEVQDHRIFYTRIPYHYSIATNTIEEKSVTHLQSIADKISKRFDLINPTEQSLSLVIYADSTPESYAMYPIEMIDNKYKINTNILLAKNIHESYIN